MKFGRQPFGLRIYGRMAELRNRLSRARYFRGHGVHSPFVYDLVRQVFMRDSLLPGPHDLHDALLSRGISRRRAVQLQNLAIHCGYASFCLDGADADLCLLTRDLTRPETLMLVRTASAAGHTVAVLSPCEGRERQALCMQLVASHRSTSVDNRGYLLLFNNYLPKQHFRL